MGTRARAISAALLVGVAVNAIEPMAECETDARASWDGQRRAQRSRVPRTSGSPGGTISSRQIDDLEPTLTGQGYEVRTLAVQFNVVPRNIGMVARSTMRLRQILISAVPHAGTPVFADYAF
jgi:hypothetical protein